jgi:lipopolysaccharide assembly protein B
MEIELWWLLALPLFFGLGWWTTRSDGGKVMPASKMPDAYFKGLNFLLNEQPDKAIDAFIDVVRLDPDTIELHFALGNLFRRRGETDRAIRVHENLAQRTDLPASQRAHALHELGQDFLKAGLMDRAEDVFHRLKGTEYEAAALGARLDALSNGADAKTHQPWMSHFRCELAAQTKDPQEALRLLKLAHETSPIHPRALIALGQWAMGQDDPEAAIGWWTQVLKLAPQAMNLIARDWLAAHQRLARLDSGLEALESVSASHAGADVLEAMVEVRLSRDGAASTRVWLEQRMVQRPSLAGLDRLLMLRVKQGELHQQTPSSGLGEQIQSDQLMRSLLSPQLGRQLRHVCGHCGFKARQFYWHCPGCSRWDSTSPVRSEDSAS